MTSRLLGTNQEFVTTYGPNTPKRSVNNVVRLGLGGPQMEIERISFSYVKNLP